MILLPRLLKERFAQLETPITRLFSKSLIYVEYLTTENSNHNPYL